MRHALLTTKGIDCWWFDLMLVFCCVVVHLWYRGGFLRAACHSCTAYTLERRFMLANWRSLREARQSFRVHFCSMPYVHTGNIPFTNDAMPNWCFHSCRAPSVHGAMFVSKANRRKLHADTLSKIMFQARLLAGTSPSIDGLMTATAAVCSSSDVVLYIGCLLLDPLKTYYI